jgi:hypothetical protein
MFDCTHRCARLHPHCSLAIKRDIAPDSKWHWSVTMPDGHIFNAGPKRGASFEATLEDMNSAGVAALLEADRVWRDYHTSLASHPQQTTSVVSHERPLLGASYDPTH